MYAHRSPLLPPPPAPPDHRRIDTAERAQLLDAGSEILECQRVLEKAGLNVVGEILRDQGEFIELEHYPRDDVFDSETRSQYYYHAHRTDHAEHGHFHLFLRTGGMSGDPTPLDDPQASEPWPRGEAAIAHLVGLSMDAWGYPIGLFCTNRWVTDETWYPAETVISMLPHFAIDHAWPSWPVNRWMTAMVRLYRHHIAVLLRHRDAVIDTWRRNHPVGDVFEDRRLEVTGFLPIAVKPWLKALSHAVPPVQRGL